MFYHSSDLDGRCAFTGEERPDFYDYGYNDYKEKGGYDPSVMDLAEQVRSLVKEVKEYMELKKALKPILGTR